MPQPTIIGREHSQGRQGRNAKLGREQPGDERQHRGPCLARPSDVPRTRGEEPAGEDGRGVVHQDGEHGAEEEADERDGHGVLNERRDDPDGDLKAGGQAARILVIEQVRVTGATYPMTRAA